MTMNKLHKIVVKKGQHIDAVNQTLQFMRQSDIYDFNDDIVTIKNSILDLHTRHSLLFWIGNHIQYVKPEKVNPNLAWIDQILSLKRQRLLKPIKAFITATLINLDGTILCKPGYDKNSELYFDDSQCDLSKINIIEKPNPDELKQALRTLMVPFKEFPVASTLDRSVLMAAILTAIMRPMLSICPGFTFDAPVAGTGKTLLAQTIAQLMLSEKEKLTTYAEDDGRGDAENRKRIFSSLISGDKCILIDNIQKPFDSISLSTLTTSSDYSDRRLGHSRKESFPVKMLVLLTGNNMRFLTDLGRRFPTIRIDAKSENLQARSFSEKPLPYVKEHRLELVSAGLTLIKGWLNTNAYQTNKTWVRRDIMSYSGDWDEFIGQTIAWMADQAWSFENGQAQFTDTAPAFAEKVQSNPDTEALGELLIVLKCIFKEESFTAKDVLLKSNVSAHKKLEQSLMEQNLSTPLNAVSIGKLLGYRKGRIINGLSIEALPMNKNTSVWKIKVALPREEGDFSTKSA